MEFYETVYMEVEKRRPQGDTKATGLQRGLPVCVGRDWEPMRAWGVLSRAAWCNRRRTYIEAYSEASVIISYASNLDVRCCCRLGHP